MTSVASDRVWAIRRPRLKPAMRRFHRDPRTLQIGVHPRRAVVLHDLEPAVLRVIERLDGTHNLRQVLDAARAEGFAEDQALTLLGMLIHRGVVEDAAASPAPLRSLSLAERDRLRPDLDALSLDPATTDCGFGALARRRSARIRVYGAGRVGAQVVTLLAAAGVGNLCVADGGTASPADVVPGGLSWAEVGGSRQEGAIAAAKRIAPSLTAWTADHASHPDDYGLRSDLVILTPVEPLDDLLVSTLTASGIPHLLATAFEGHGSVGPLVLPGRTACLRCITLTRRDRDPAWPVVSTRLGGFPVGESACDATLAAQVAAATTAQALAYLDGLANLVTNGALDVFPGGEWRRRSWSVHPRCGCIRL